MFHKPSLKLKCYIYKAPNKSFVWDAPLRWKSPQVLNTSITTDRGVQNGKKNKIRFLWRTL